MSWHIVITAGISNTFRFSSPLSDERTCHIPMLFPVQAREPLILSRLTPGVKVAVCPRPQEGPCASAHRVWACQTVCMACQPAAGLLPREPTEHLRPLRLSQAPTPSCPVLVGPHHRVSRGPRVPAAMHRGGKRFCLSHCLSVAGVPSITTAVPQEQQCQPEEGSYTVSFQ